MSKKNSKSQKPNSKKKKAKTEESDFYVPLALPTEIDVNKYLHKKPGFVPQDMEVGHKREKPATGINFEINLD